MSDIDIETADVASVKLEAECSRLCVPRTEETPAGNELPTRQPGADLALDLSMGQAHQLDAARGAILRGWRRRTSLLP